MIRHATTHLWKNTNITFNSNQINKNILDNNKRLNLYISKSFYRFYCSLCPFMDCNVNINIKRKNVLKDRYSSYNLNDFYQNRYFTNLSKLSNFFSFKKRKKEQNKNIISDDIDKSYYPGNVYKSTSKRLVLFAMAGNTAITIIKLLAWGKTGSSAMLSEAIHSLVDTGNQGLLFLGLQQAAGVPDKKHQYGYGRAAYFWSLISALGIFWLGAGVTVSHGVNSMMHPPTELSLSWEIWSVLLISVSIDGWVLNRAIKEVQMSKPPNISFYKHVQNIKDPFMMAVLLEDCSACIGVIIAMLGIGATHITGDPFWDSAASISIGCLLGAVAVTLIRLNQRFLLGQSVDADIEDAVKKLLLARSAIDNVYAVQSQWVGPSTFSYKAEVDFDGTYLAAKLHHDYKSVILDSKNLQEDLPVILSWYAEDVTRLVEKEVKEVEAEIRSLYPEAAFIELEPDSKDSELQAISNFKTSSLRKIEKEAMMRAIAELARTLERTKTKKAELDNKKHCFQANLKDAK